MDKKLKKLKVRMCAAGMVIATAGITFPAAVGTLPVESVYAAGDVEINAKNFPDENFRKYVSDNIDSDGNGKLSEGEINGCTEIGWGINYEVYDIQDFTGVEHFTALEKLHCDDNNLTSLDVSKNTALKELYCSINNLSSLDASKNTALEDLCCGDNNLSSLDVSKNTRLIRLNCDNNNLSSLDVSKNTALEDLMCYGNNLSNLDVSKNTALEVFFCYDNNLSSLNVRGAKALKGLSCENNQLSSLDVSKNTKLEYLYCQGNNLSSLDVSNNTKLIWLHCDNNNLSSLDVSKNTALSYFSCESQKRDVIVSNNEITLTDLDPDIKADRISNVKGAVLSGNKFINITGNTVTYDYDTGYRNNDVDKTMDVTLNVKIDTRTGLYNVNGQWVYIKNGKTDISFTGLAKNTEDKLLFLRNGVFDNSYTGFAIYDEDGKEYFVKDGIVSGDFSSAVLTVAQQKYGVNNTRTLFATTPEQIQSSLKAAGENATAENPYIVYAMQGNYKMPKKLVVPENVTLVAEKKTVFEPATDKNFTQFFTVFGNIYGGTYECKNMSTYGLRFGNVAFKGNNGTIERTNVNNAKKAGIVAVGSDTRFTFVYNNNINGCGNSGVAALSGGWIAIVSGNKIRNNNGAGINIDHGNVNIIRNNAITGNKGNGIHTNSGGSKAGHKYCHIHKIRCNEISGNGGDGVYIDSKCYVDKIFSKNTIKNNRKNGVSIAANAYINVFAKNTTDGNSASNIYVDGKKAVLNMGNTNTITNAKANNITVVNKGKVNIYGKKNTITNAGNNGILVNDGGILLITGKSNSIKNSAKFGLKLSGGSTARISNTKFANNGGYAVKVKKGSTLKYDKTCNISEKQNAKNRVSIDK